MMEAVIWFLIMIPCCTLFTGIGIYAMKRKKPMWFWSGTTVPESEIRDIPAYNRANGIMWILFSVPLWISMGIYLWSAVLSVILLCLSFLLGIPVLIVTYQRIYQKYRNPLYK